MRVFDKTLSYWWEIIGGQFVGIIVAIIIFLINPSLSAWKDFVLAIPSMGLCIFGFLLTLLGLILQGNSTTISWMRSRKNLFDRFIQYNKKIVILSLIISIYAYFLGYTDFHWLIDTLYFVPITTFLVIRKLAIGIFCGLITWFVINTLYFIKLFYILIKEPNDI